MTTPRSPEKSAAERARELLERMPGPGTDMRLLASGAVLIEELLQDLAAATERVKVADDRDNRWLRERNEARAALAEATERAERAEKELVHHRQSAACYKQEAVSWRVDYHTVAEERSRLEAELKISRAAMDRTRQDADAQLGRLSGLQYSHDSAWKIIDELKRKFGVTGMRSGDAEDELCTRIGMACDAVEAVRDLQREREHSGWNSTPFWRKAKALSEMPLPPPPKET